jgi:transcriptional regulator
MNMKQTDMNQLLDMVTEQRNKAEAEVKQLKAELLRFEAALDRILNNCSDEDLVIDITSEALYGDR